MRHRTRHGTSWVSLCVAVVLMLTDGRLLERR